MSRNRNPTVLIVGSQADDVAMYPHLRAVIDGLRGYVPVTYHRFPLSGFEWTTLFSDGDLLTALKKMHHARFLLDTARREIPRVRAALASADIVIAVNYFAWLVCSSYAPANARVVYWSLDIFTNRIHLYGSPVRFICHVVGGRRLRQRPFVIIQDEDRLHLLKRSHFLGEQTLEVFFLPVSLPAMRYPLLERPPHQPPVVMQIGGVGEFRRTSELIRCYESQSRPTFQLLLQGYHFSRVHEPEVAGYLRAPLVPPDEVWKVVADCDIGFVGYKVIDENHYRLKNASGQLVEFLRLGKPVVVLGDCDLRELVQKEGVGRHLASIDELPGAVETIIRSYGVFSLRARQYFARRMNLELFLHPLADWLRSL